MASTEIFYSGYGQGYEGFSDPNAYRISAGSIAYPTDVTTANQLKKVSDKISSGAKTIEVSGLSIVTGSMRHLAAVPRQHWKEIDRLRQLTGVDLTFHGPLVEPTGFNGKTNWSEEQRVEVQKQMMAAVELAQQMNTEKIEKNKTGIVMTFHANNGLPEVERKIMVNLPNGKREERVVQMSVCNEHTGQIGQLPVPKADYFEGGKEGSKIDMKRELEKFNNEQWTRQVESVFINSTKANNEISEALSEANRVDAEMKKTGMGYDPKDLFETYKLYKENYNEYKKGIEEAQNLPYSKKVINNMMLNLQNANFFVDETYMQMKDLYNQAYDDAKNKAEKGDKSKQEALKKLDNYREDLKKTFEEYGKTSDVILLQRKIAEGTRLLAEKDVRPESWKELKTFAVEKGGETFANVALHAYEIAKKNGVAPGIISIENPPAGMSGLTRADEIKDLVEEARKRFVRNAVDRKIMSESQAEEQAKKMIGATWDVGHINSIRKWGYTKEDVLGEAYKVKDIVKHVHLADNLGFEDAELPMGMGNVPIDEIMNSEWSENFRKAKKVVETGDWFSRQGGLAMTNTPIRESLSALGSPVYTTGPSMGNAGAAYWNDAVNIQPGYFGGLGPINPDVHQSIYGGGFGQLPAYLGAELPGKATNSSFSGAPLE